MTAPLRREAGLPRERDFTAAEERAEQERIEVEVEAEVG
jgi:hypothetical protein